MPESYLSAQEGSEEHSLNILRPTSLREFFGQATIKENLAIFIRAALQRGEALDHVFFSGPPGLGKTTLASIIAQEMHCDLRITAAPALEKPKDLAGILTTIGPRGIFFVDEIHRLRPAIEEMLYTAMEEFSLDWVIGQGPAARTIRIPVPEFTLVGATTRPGGVSSPLHTRFGIQFRLDYYRIAEIKEILRRTGSILNVTLDAEAEQIIAKSCRGTPRVANRLMRRLRDFSQVEGSSCITGTIAQKGMQQLGIDTHGLEERDRSILKTVLTQFKGGPVGIDALTAALGENSDNIEYYYEPYLIRQGWLQRTPRGRIATEKTYTLFALPSAEDPLSEVQQALFE